MKIISIVTLALQILFCFGQDTIEVRKGDIGVAFWYNGNKLKTKEMKRIMRPYPEAYNNIIKARKSNIAAGIFGFAGGFSIGYALGQFLVGAETKWWLMGLGGGMVGLTIPIAINGTKKTKKAVEIYNAEAIESP